MHNLHVARHRLICEIANLKIGGDRSFGHKYINSLVGESNFTRKDVEFGIGKVEWLERGYI